MTSRLGVYWSVEHRRPQDYDYFEDLQPSVLKIMDGGPPDYEHAREAVPDTLLIARDWALSEQHSDMLANPAETGMRHAREWSEHQPKLGFDPTRTLILGINEPHIWEPGVAEALRVYTIALCDEAFRRGLRVGAMQLSVGWPNNNGPDTLPDWSPWHGVEEAILRGNHVLITHEYWADKGPSENFGWWAGRTLKCPWQVPFAIGECGVDMFVKDTSVGQQHRGWIGHFPPERYAAELWEYTSRMSADARYLGCCVFASDFQAHEWYSFDVEPAYRAILATPIPDTPPVITHLPAIGNNPPKTAYVAVPSGANLRKAPRIDGDLITAIPYGEPITVYADDAGMGWSLVEYQGRSGYMNSSLFTFAEPVSNPGPTQPVKPPSGDCWARAREFVRRWEGEYQNNPADIGNWTGCEVGKGENRGTKFGISACSYPELDIPNLSMEEATAIYERDYWRASGADKLPWPYCLLVFDTAVLHGVGTARKWQEEVGNNPYAFAAKRLHTYTKLSNWSDFGAGWANRTADLLEEMAT